MSQLFVYKTRLFWYTEKEMLEKSYRLVLKGFSKRSSENFWKW